ncbi:hypothetical protein G6F57_007509 [Rhizopus arrhizus]|uniref:GATA-type domain-containing protein n=1 Tax=Rhizopus oryzae TaxID=64495 RepID=A0A9P7BRR9_RHIOR|nr:hypothetical protein G6F23_010905 [Rhizopus arrhizus]KAG0762021.1 hypothetical protein G6F24_007124 [Rhizopus arrhizus]KAG0788951.1 hypothetical protein G6F21_006852 [Rhizopus arrhizus]KAG0810429.1 hypothetical protein G6F20_007972 [Rhizopus arrhizus]KAG0828647.1 hypothetical protein G6F19_008135 [Rhizopus arrhizus]
MAGYMPLRLSVKPEELPSASIFLNDINTEGAASGPSPSCCSTTQRLNSICPGFEHFAHRNVNHAQQESNNDLNSLLQMSRADGFTASCSSQSSSFSSSNSENSSSSPKRCYPLMLMKTYKAYKTIHTHRCSDYCFQSTMTAVNHRCNGSNLDTEQVGLTNKDGCTKVVRKRDVRKYCCSVCKQSDSTRWRFINGAVKCEKCIRSGY